MPLTASSVASRQLRVVRQTSADQDADDDVDNQAAGDRRRGQEPTAPLQRPHQADDIARALFVLQLADRTAQRFVQQAESDAAAVRAAAHAEADRVLAHARTATQRLAETERQTHDRLTELFEDQLTVLSGVASSLLTAAPGWAVA